MEHTITTTVITSHWHCVQDARISIFLSRILMMTDSFDPDETLCIASIHLDQHRLSLYHYPTEMCKSVKLDNLNHFFNE